MSDDRITALDGVRAIAVFAVIGFHYFTRWTPPGNATNYYPYDGALAEVWLFQYGYFGVELFFLVSGFVITLTLNRCRSWQDFTLRRFARLAPPMLLASMVTFVVVSWVPPHLFSVRAVDFLPSLTFTAPDVINAILGIESSYVDGAYWSLFVEVRFYFWAALLYFCGTRTEFLQRCGWLMQASVVALVLRSTWPEQPWAMPLEVVLLGKHGSWLIAGTAFYYVWSGERRWLAWALIAQSFVVNATYNAYADSWSAACAVMIVYALFCGFIVRPAAFRMLSAPWLTAVGAASYSLYLLHQRIGVTLIAAISDLMGITGSPWSISVAVLVAVLLAFAAIACYRYYEVPTRRAVMGVGVRWGLIPASNRA
jgi:peptidoglycan/LPS O-acetylase OafA/YrhL